MKLKLYLSMAFLCFNFINAQRLIEASYLLPLTGENTYALNQTASPLQFQLGKCTAFITGTQTPTNYTLTWYSNTTNSTTGGTVMNAGLQSQVTLPSLLLETISFVPPTNVVGTRYYYAVLSNPSSTLCGFTTTLVTNTQQVTVAVPATHLNFDGSNDYVTLPTTSTNIPAGNSNYTLEAWINPSILQQRGIVGWGDYGQTNKVNAFRLSPTGLVNYWWGSDLGVNYTFTLGTWYHVAATYDGTTRKIYVNGIVVGQDTPPANTLNVTNTSNVTIGRTNDPLLGLEYFNGSLDDVRVWNVARTEQQIFGSKNCELQGTETGLIAYYKFNQGLDAANNTTITTLTNSVSGGSNGTLNNFTLTGSTSNFLAGSPVTTGSVIPAAPTVTTPVVYNQGAAATALTATTGGTGLLWYTTATGGTALPGAPTPLTTTPGNTSYWVASTNANGCQSDRVQIVVTVNAPGTHLNFDGTNDYIAIPPTAINNLPQGTISVWVYANSLTNQTICAKQSDFENTYALFTIGGYAPNGKIYYQSKNTATPLISSTTLVTGQWYHLAVTFDNTQAKLYINGVLDNTVAGDFSLPDDITVTATTIGSWLGSGGGQYFNGKIDEFRVWKRVLMATDITNTQNCEAQAQADLVTYYKFNQGFNNAANSTITTATDSAGTNNGTLNGFALTGATSNWASGSTVTTGNNCTVLGNENFEISNNFKMYPNPAKNTLTIEVQSLENAAFDVFDINGRQLFSQKLNATANTLNIENLASGIYLFKISSSQGTATSKVVKQ
jgi:Concanavalin A-like lectin/glucanases superfamily/Secretion system C-terminal sorting domain/Ig-like domain CHU_C associated